MLRRGAIFGVVCGCGLLLALPAFAQQQDNSAPPQQNQTTTRSNQKKDQKKPSTSAQSPFPAAKSEDAAKQSQQQEDHQEQNGSPSAPAPLPEQKPKSTAAQNPFPEAQSEKAARANQGNQDQGDSAPPASSTHNGDFSSSQVKGMDLPDTKAGPSTGPAAPLAYNPKVAKKDVQVGMFYLDTGNFKGAYDRFQEATTSDPGNADAVYGLAESARRTGKPDEALRNYRLYLSALPDGPHAKEVRRAMKEMGAEPPA